MIPMIINLQTNLDAYDDLKLLIQILEEIRKDHVNIEFKINVVV